MPRFSLKTLLANRSDPNKLLTPLVDQFLLTTDLTDFTGEELDLVKTLIAKWSEIRSIEHHSPSSAVACLRQQMLTFWGHKPIEIDDPFLKSIFDDGNWRHIRWHLIFARMQRAGLLRVVSVEKRILYRRWLMGGTPDDVLDIPTEDGLVRVVVDIKGAHNDKFKWIQANNQPVDGHEWQLHDYMAGLRLGRGILWYENKNDQGYHELIIPRNIEMIRELDRRYKILRQARKSGVLPSHGCSMDAQGNVDPKDQMFKRCRQRMNCLRLTKTGY